MHYICCIYNIYVYCANIATLSCRRSKRNAAAAGVEGAAAAARRVRLRAVGSGQGLEVSDFVARFCTLREASDFCRTFLHVFARFCVARFCRTFLQIYTLSITVSDFVPRFCTSHAFRVSVCFSHVRVFSDSRNVQKSVTQIIYLGPLPCGQARAGAGPGGAQGSQNPGKSARAIQSVHESVDVWLAGMVQEQPVTRLACWNGTGTDRNPASWNRSGRNIHKYAKNMQSYVKTCNKYANI